jgi:hypothetical protein
MLDPTLAVELVTKIAAKPPKERQEIYRLSQSEDSRDRSLALTKSKELPPMPDPRLDLLDNAIKSLRNASEPYPKDPLTPRISAAIADLKAIRNCVKQVSYDASQKTQGGAIQ